MPKDFQNLPEPSFDSGSQEGGYDYPLVPDYDSGSQFQGRMPHQNYAEPYIQDSSSYGDNGHPKQNVDAWSSHMGTDEWTTRRTIPLHRPSSSQFQGHGEQRTPRKSPHRNANSGSNYGDEADDPDIDIGILPEQVFDMSSTPQDAFSDDSFGFDDEEDMSPKHRRGRSKDSEQVSLSDISDILDGEFSKMEKE